MAEYSLGFAENLIRAAECLGPSESSADQNRAVLYLSLLASEIALKSLLEKAGFEVPQIRKQSHDLDALQDMVGECLVPYKGAGISAGTSRWPIGLLQPKPEPA